MARRRGRSGGSQDRRRLDVSSAELRRQVRQSQTDHTASLTVWRDQLSRLFGDEDGEGPRDCEIVGNPAGLLPDSLGSGVSRRRFISVSGLGLLSSAALAACTSSRSKRTSGGSSTSSTDETSTTVPIDPDVAILRLASSLEHSVIAVYQQAAGLDLVKNQALLDATTYFSTQHADHAGLFQSLTAQKGGQPFSNPNQAILDFLRPRIAALATEADVIKLAYDVEGLAAATYLSVVATFKDAKLNATTMSVAGIESRHVSVLGMVLSGQPRPTPGIAERADSSPYALQGFQTAAGAIPPGTGI